MPTQKESRENLPSQKLSRSELNYGLPRLTIAEAARELRVQPEEVTAWLGKLLHRKIIGWSQWSKWRNDAEPLAESMIRLYLVQNLEGEEKWHAQFQAFLRKRKEMARGQNRAAVVAQKKKQRAAG